MDFKKISIPDLQLKHQLDVNPANGGVTGSVDIPLPEGRNNFGPGLSLNYSTAARNSAFGVGWSLSGIPFITIDTKKGLPKYDGSDNYAFGGGISLVPALVRVGTEWTQRMDETAGHWIYYYSPEIEESFTRFEKWVGKDNHTIHWRTVTGDDVVSVYGIRDGIISNPEKAEHRFVWLLEEQYDNRGNAVRYQYKSENADGVDALRPSEYNRMKKASKYGFTQKYPDRIQYGNSVPLLPGQPVPAANRWLFEVVFDYGEYALRPRETTAPAREWPARPDPFSAYQGGFEMRTYRLCRRILSYHNIPDLSAKPSLTGIFDIAYHESPLGCTVAKLAFMGVRRDLVDGTYTEKALPPLSFSYTEPKPDATFNPSISESNINVPQGFNSPDTRFIDLLGEGLPGILSEAANNWYYKRNKGNGFFDQQETVLSKPSQLKGIYALGDFDRNGNLDLFTLQGRTAGYYEYDTRKAAWTGFTPFRNIPQVSHAKFMDINADGFADIVVETDDKLTCYPFEGKEGFGKPFELAKPVSNGVAYAPMLGDNLMLDYFMADMTGDGLPDQVRIQNGRVEYFPNLGNGRFGESVLMEDAPVIDFDKGFDAGRIRLYDLDGSGTTDVIYLGRGEIRYWYNASGNRFVEGGRITGLPYIDLQSSAQVMDLLGNGTPCLVWSNALNAASGSPIQYLQLTGGEKPRLMMQLDNGMGALTQIRYGFSGTHYLEAERRGKPWISKIPAHFTVADQKIVVDTITNSRIASTYRYYDGHYDGNERSFVCFGCVEQYDVETLETAVSTHDTNHTQPACTKTWLHPGVFGWNAKKASNYYDKDGNQPFLPPPFFESDSAQSDRDFMLGYRSLAGKVLRKEVYGVKPDGGLEEHPFSVSQQTYAIRNIQPATAKHRGSCYAYQTEVLEIAYDRVPDDPKVAHHLALEVDEFGNITKEMSVAYARRSTASGIHLLPGKDYITADRHWFRQVNSLDRYQIGVLYESKGYELSNVARNAHGLVPWTAAKAAFDTWAGEALAVDAPWPTGTAPVARLLEWGRTYFWNDAQTAVLPLGQTGKVVLAHHEETACFNDGLIDGAFNGKIAQNSLSHADEGNYMKTDGYWWQRTATNHFNDSSGFFAVDKVEKQPGIFTTYQYDGYFLAIVETTDPLGNKAKGDIDYNVVEPYRLVDANDNVSEVLYDALGVPAVTTYHGTILHEGADKPYGQAALSAYSRRDDGTFDHIIANPGLYLQNAATFLHYDMLSTPLRSVRLTKENLLHDGKGNVNGTPLIQIDLDYQDGFGRIIQSKQKGEPGPALQRKPDGTLLTDAHGEPVSAHAASRWLVSGHVVYNNKQLPIRQFEPFFSDTHLFENDTLLESYGVSVNQYYDAIGRMYRTDFPNATFSETLFTPWEVKSLDQNDTVDRSMYKVFREIQAAGSPERMALDKSLAHKETPSIIQFDTLGRAIVQIATNNDGTVRKIETTFDIQGNPVQITDARGLTAFAYKRDMLGRLLYEYSMDAGEKWSFHNNDDQTIHLWDSRDVHQRTHYDALDRVTRVHVDGALVLDHTTERFVYGEDSVVAQAKQKNLRGGLVIHYDQAGVQELKLAAPGNLPLHTERRLLNQFTGEPDWSNPATVGLSAEVYASRYTYDGLGRAITQQLPDETTRTYVFNQGGGLQKVLLSTADGVLSDLEILKNASYDAKGMRQQVLLGNDVEIAYTYDAETFRMKRLRSAKAGATPRTYQDIHYTYDPMGNLVHLVDKAQQPAAAGPRVMEGLNVSAHAEFEYDALYQLTSATGRVHQALLQNDYADRSGQAGVPADWGKGTRHITLNNGAAVERYTRTYAYDEAGNIKSIKHTGVSQNWTKQIWTSAASNRSLPLLDLNGQPVSSPEDRFDANGNCIYLPHLRSLEWNYRNNISKAVIIDRSAQGKPNDEEYYVYGGDGMRVRKISQRVIDVANGTIELIEKIYLEGCEIKRITRGGTEILKRFTSAINDGEHTIARIHAWAKDTQARETDDVTRKSIHYQLANHLGSAALELDEQGDVITYEEYFPYGGTAFMAGRNRRDIDLKAYRYSGKERDDFTGLYYFGFRYYAHWIGGWINPDPLGPEDGENLYLYVHNNPVNVVDPNGLQSTGTYRSIGTVRTGLTAEEAMSQFNAGQGIRLGIRVQELERRGDDWVITRYRNLTEAELERFRQIQDQWAENPEIAEMFTELEVALGEMGTSDLTGTGEGTGTGDDGNDGNDGNEGNEGNGNEGAGEAADEEDATGSGVKNGDGGDGSQTTGNGANTGDGRSATPGAGGTGHNGGRRGAGTGDSGTASDTSGSGTTGGNGHGAGSGPGRSERAGTGGQGDSGTNGRSGGQAGGSRNGVHGGRIGGSPDGVLGGQPGGDPRGSLDGDVNGVPDGIPNGSPEGSNEGEEQRNGNPRGNATRGTGQEAGDQSTGDRANQQGNQGQQGSGGQQGQGGDPRTNWLDTATRWAGYLNLEFGGNEGGGEAGGVPGGLDLFGWRPPMWVRRTLQVVYIATTVITTIIPIGKAALAAKVAIQGALKVGLRATARQLLTRVAAMIPSRAAVRGALTKARSVIGSGLARIGGLFRPTGVRAMAAGATSSTSPGAVARGLRWLMFRGKQIPHTVAPPSSATALGTTAANGAITIKPGLSAAQHAETLFHEGAHRFLTPLGNGALTRARQTVGMWGYNNSHLLRYLEEGFAQSVGSGSFKSGFGWINSHVASGGYGLSATRIIGEGTLYVGGILGTGYAINRSLADE